MVTLKLRNGGWRYVHGTNYWFSGVTAEIAVTLMVIRFSAVMPEESKMY
jgi:hypothetical protein